MNKKLSQANLNVIGIIGDGKCLFQLLSIGLYGHQNSHVFIRRSLADSIELRGTILDGLIECSSLDFRNYVNALRTPGNYDYVSEDLVIVVTKIFKRKIHICSATVDVQIFRPRNGTSSKRPITIVFFLTSTLRVSSFSF